jgi:hypothetical protein
VNNLPPVIDLDPMAGIQSSSSVIIVNLHRCF